MIDATIDQGPHQAAAGYAPADDMPSMEPPPTTLACIPVGATHCTAVVAQGTLLKIARDPVKLDSKKGLKGLDDDVDFLEARQHREIVQRAFDGAKKGNVPSYARYIAETRGPVNLARRTDSRRPSRCIASSRFIMSRPMVGLGGPESPAGSRSPIRTRCTRSTATRNWRRVIRCARRTRGTRTDPVVVTIVHGESYLWAMAAFHAVNTFQVDVTKSIRLARDVTDPVMILIRDLIKSHSVLNNRVEMAGKNLKPHDDTVITLATLHAATMAFFGGVSRAVSWEGKTTGDEVASLKAAYLDWFGDVFHLLADRFALRNQSVIGAPPSMVAIGCLGHMLRHGNPFTSTTPTKTDQLESILRVNFAKGEHWLGINMERSSGKTKETLVTPGGHLQWRRTSEALANPQHPSYHQIRTH